MGLKMLIELTTGDDIEAVQDLPLVCASLARMSDLWSSRSLLVLLNLGLGLWLARTGVSLELNLIALVHLV